MAALLDNCGALCPRSQALPWQPEKSSIKGRARKDRLELSLLHTSGMLNANRFAFALFLLLVPQSYSLKLSLGLEIDGHDLDLQFDPHQSLASQAAHISGFKVGEKKLVEYLSDCDETQDTIPTFHCVQDMLVSKMEVSRVWGGEERK